MTRFLFGLLLTVVAQQLLSSIVCAQDVSVQIRSISAWGKNIRESLERGSISRLRIDASTLKKGPERVVSVQQFHLDSLQILHILQPAAIILQEGEFEVIDQDNVAETRVAFEFELAQVCYGNAGRFVIASSGNSMFYIGCTVMNDSGVTQREFLRIRSAKLYKILRRHFPREILN